MEKTKEDILTKIKEEILDKLTLEDLEGGIEIYSKTLISKEGEGLKEKTISIELYQTEDKEWFVEDKFENIVQL